MNDKACYIGLLKARDFKRLELLQINAEGNHVIITGENGSGKSSGLDAIWAAFDPRGPQLKDPIRHGAEGPARVDVDVISFSDDSILTKEFHLERSWDDKGTRIEVTAADGSKIKDGTDLVKRFYGRVAINLNAFLDARPQDQVDMVLKICRLDPPVDEVETITGKRHDAQPNESADRYLQRLSGDNMGLYYEERKQAGRIWDEKKKALADWQKEVEAEFGKLPADADVPTSELHKKLNELLAAQDKRRAVVQKVEQTESELIEVSNRLGDRRRQLQEQTTKVAKLRAELEKAIAEEEELKDKIKKGERIYAEVNIDLERDRQTLAALPDPAPEIEAVRAQLAEGERREKLVAKQQAAAEHLERLTEESEAAKAEYESLDRILEKLRSLRRNLLNNIDLGVPGLSVGNGELLLDGVTFSQASTAQSIETAAMIGMLQNPRLRICLVDNGEHLDKKTRQRLFDFGNRHGIQFWFACSVPEGELKFEIIERNRVAEPVA